MNGQAKGEIYGERWKANGQVEGKQSGGRRMVKWEAKEANSQVEGERSGERRRRRRFLGRRAQAMAVPGSVSSPMKSSMLTISLTMSATLTVPVKSLSSSVEVFLVRESSE